jgi:hypothetical protein
VITTTGTTTATIIIAAFTSFFELELDAGVISVTIEFEMNKSDVEVVFTNELGGDTLFEFFIRSLVKLVAMLCCNNVEESDGFVNEFPSPITNVTV